MVILLHHMCTFHFLLAFFSPSGIYTLQVSLLVMATPLLCKQDFFHALLFMRGPFEKTTNVLLGFFNVVFMVW